MGAIIYNAESINAERKLLNDKRPAGDKVILVTAGSAQENLKTKSGNVVRLVVSEKVQNEDMNVLRYRIKNSGPNPSQADIEAFWGKYYLDLQRPSEESVDLTSLIAREVTDPSMAETANVRDYEPFRGYMKKISGTGDSVPLIQENTGNLDTFTLGIYGVGFQNNLKDVLFNPWFDYNKVLTAARDADTDLRNSLIVGYIVGITYAASQKQAAIVDANATSDELMYATLAAGWQKLLGLKDIYTSKKIPKGKGVYLLCNSTNTWRISNVIKGQLNAVGAGARGKVAPELPIKGIIEYDGGINDGQTINDVVQSFPGVAAGKCYLFVPGVIIAGNKVPFTTETGSGNVLELSTEAKAFYRVMGVFTKQFMGTSWVGSTCGAGYGYIVEVTLPA